MAAWLGIAIEFLAPLALIVGAGARPAGAALALFMAVAASTHTSNGFFMNWVGRLPAGAEGFEYHVLAIALAVAVAARGAGAWSLDGWLTHGTPHAQSRIAPRSCMARRRRREVPVSQEAHSYTS